MTVPRTPLSVVGGTKRRRYSQRTKVTTVIAAEMSSVTATAEATGIPATTIDYWMDEPEFVKLREKTREDLAEESRTLAHKVLSEIKRRLGDFEPRDLTILWGVLTDKSQLLAGQATSRTETKDITATLEDHEKEALADAIDDWLKERVPA